MLTVTRALAFSLLLASTARAAGSGECVPGEPITDSAGYAVAATSAGRYMQLASAASYAERAILPSLTQGVPRSPAIRHSCRGALPQIPALSCRHASR